MCIIFLFTISRAAAREEGEERSGYALLGDGHEYLLCHILF